MTFAQDLQFEFEKALRYGNVAQLKFYTASGATSGYDDNFVLTQSGTTLWTSGLLMPLSGKYGSKDASLLEQGKLFSNDSVLFLNGSIPLSGTFKVGIGSPSSVFYQKAIDGVEAYGLDTNIVYYKVYLRALQNGSLVGEA